MECKYDTVDLRLKTLENITEKHSSKIADLEMDYVSLASHEKIYIAIIGLVGLLVSTFGTIAGTLISRML